MRVVMFYHSLLSDWNHGNAHFLRGVASELVARGHAVTVYEPRDNWSLSNLLAGHGEALVEEFVTTYPGLDGRFHGGTPQELEAALDGADLVLVHEWNDPALVAALGRMRAAGGTFRLFFHDTHHRALSAPAAMAAFDLRDYDGVLAFGEVIRRLYIERGWAARAWTWHEAADTRVYRPLPADGPVDDLAWIGNWGDGERTAELRDFLLEPVRALGLRANVYGVRYPERALTALVQAGIAYHGWLPNFRAPRVYARHRATVHIPRRYYANALPGIPTIRVFEALACAVPLVCAPWEDAEGLFRPGTDFLVARTPAQMRAHLATVMRDPAGARALSAAGHATVLARHTCAHRVDELLGIVAQLGAGAQHAVA
jgi:spore maturation protein CgeB